MTDSSLKKVLITGAGSGFGFEAAMRLAQKGFDVIAAVEIYAQVQTLKWQAAERKVQLRVEKLDVTNEGDRHKALDWGVEILVNNAASEREVRRSMSPAPTSGTSSRSTSRDRCSSPRASPSR
ncbi:SDR family NAD(P)-dependent oxidoreductase [Streptomyces sp. NPDC048489]|uniref:SDR family NAD(P)-dependent oxidoreductase n=1 Tax=Streptomyces sp. NPDC048489 TaxID=3154504 RepID=UPI00341A44BB